MKERIFISVGMTGRNGVDVLNDLYRAEKKIELLFKVHNLDFGDIELVDNFYCEKPENAERLYCLGEAIKKLGDCDACYFVKGWRKYRGCRIERKICKLYNIRIIDEP